MADDLDDLLNEVETKFCDPNKSAKGKSPSGPGTGTSTAANRVGAQSNVSSSKKKKSDLDDMIDDIIGDDVDHDPLENSSAGTLTSSMSSGGASGVAPSRKCFPVYIGGSSCARGLSTAVKQRACDNIRCTDCDFQIVSFDNFSWHKTVDYLFLRNNIPDFDRLRSKLIPKKGSRAYACQCKSTTSAEVEELQRNSNLKSWFCGKH